MAFTGMRALWVAAIGVCALGLAYLAHWSLASNGAISPPTQGPDKGTTDGLVGARRPPVSAALATGNGEVAEPGRTAVEEPPKVHEPKRLLDEKTRQGVERSLRESRRQLDAAWEAQCSGPGSGVDGEKTLSDALKDMAALIPIRRYEAALQMLAQDDYQVFPAGAKTMEAAVVPRDHSPVRMYNVIDSTGTPLDLMFVVPNSNPSVKMIDDELRSMRAAQATADVALFNSLPESERRRRIAAHKTALAAVIALRQDLTMPAEERQRRFAELSKDLLPSRWVICGEDSVTTTASAK